MNNTKKVNTAPRITRDDVRVLPDAADGLAWVVIGPYCWGKGSNASRVLELARREGSRGVYTFHLVNAGAEIDLVNGTVYHCSTTPGLRLNAGAIRLN